MIRASLAGVTFPKLAELKLVVTVEKFVWLSRLNVSARNCSYMFSQGSLVFWKREKSQHWKLGLVTTPRPAFPGRSASNGVARNAAVLKNDATECCAPSFGLLTRSGRALDALAPSKPKPPLSVFDVVTVSGVPV